MEVDRMFYIKPNLKNMSQGARLEYIRERRGKHEISDEENLEWKFNFKLENELKG